VVRPSVMADKNANETITNLIPLLKQAALAVGHKKYKRNLK